MATPLYEDLGDVLSRAAEAGVKRVVNICTDQETLARGLHSLSAYEGLYLTAATTPHDVEGEGESFFPLVEKAASEKKLVAIGETGLDYHYEHSPKEKQKKYLRLYLQLAKKHALPVVIHCREAFPDLFKILGEEYQGGAGVLHCFTGTLEEAKKVIESGLYLSLSGIVTFKKSDMLQEVASWMPLERLLIETDAPYLAPQSKRGKTNEPAFLLETAIFIAKLKGVTLEELARVTSQNARSLFTLP